MKVCKTCKQEKPLKLFPKNVAYKDGFRPHCIDCRREYENASFHKNKHKRPYCYETDKDKKLQKAYGIGYAEYLKMLEAQNNSCAICGTTDTGNRKAFHVDHCHTTGKVRGLLCSNCNTGIGNLRDDVALLHRAIDYLKSTLG
jgi:hypothetical protein